MKEILYSLVYNIYPMKGHGRPELSDLFNDQCFHHSMGIGTCSPILRLLIRLLYVITYDLLGSWYHCSPLLWCCFNQLGEFLYFGNNITPCCYDFYLCIPYLDSPYFFFVNPWRHTDVIMTSLTYDIILTSLWPHFTPLYSTTTSSSEHYKYSSIS